ncbi:hypothetical protein EON66_04055 [archaeon]|nr:MAG: hypothetical protein EON66_04055 [archaeon]
MSLRFVTGKLAHSSAADACHVVHVGATLPVSPCLTFDSSRLLARYAVAHSLFPTAAFGSFHPCFFTACLHAASLAATWSSAPCTLVWWAKRRPSPAHNTQ